MSALTIVQVSATLACLAAALLNLKMMFRWRRRYLAMRPVCKVVLHEGRRRLGIVGSLPEVGTVLYRLDEAPATREHTVSL